MQGQRKRYEVKYISCKIFQIAYSVLLVAFTSTSVILSTKHCCQAVLLYIVASVHVPKAFGCRHCCCVRSTLFLHLFTLHV